LREPVAGDHAVELSVRRGGLHGSRVEGQSFWAGT
jgi:hypothetical protein